MVKIIFKHVCKFHILVWSDCTRCTLFSFAFLWIFVQTVVVCKGFWEAMKLFMCVCKNIPVPGCIRSVCLATCHRTVHLPSYKACAAILSFARRFISLTDVGKKPENSLLTQSWAPGFRPPLTSGLWHSRSWQLPSLSQLCSFLGATALGQLPWSPALLAPGSDHRS